MSKLMLSSKVYLLVTLLLPVSLHGRGSGNSLSNSGKVEQGSSTMKNTAGTSDRERAELRGPVRTCVEERTYEFGKTVTTTGYDPSGRLLESHTTNSDGSESTNIRSYDAEGRLLRSSWGRPGNPPASETINSYDDKGKLLSVINRGQVFDPAKVGSAELGAPTETIESYTYDESGRLIETRATGDAESRTKYEYDGRGGKIITRTFAPKTPQNKEKDKLVAVAGSPFDTAQTGYGVPDGGAVTTIYDKSDVPAEVQVHDAQGHLVTRSTRSYDAHAQVSEDKQVVESPEFMLRSILPAEIQEHLTTEMLGEAATLFGGRSGFYGASYTYDAQDRVTHMSRQVGPMREEVETSYNEHGDKAEDHTVTITGSGRVTSEQNATGGGEPTPESKFESEVRYSYQYDNQGNWTEQTVTYRSGPDEAFKDSSVSRRKLTYY